MGRPRVVKRQGLWWVVWDGRGYPFLSWRGACGAAVQGTAAGYIPQGSWNTWTDEPDD